MPWSAIRRSWLFAVIGCRRSWLRGRFRRGALLAGLLGLCLSISVELLQTMSASRSPAATDLATNFTGALGGGIAAARWEATLAARFHQRLTALVRSRPGLLIFGLYLAAIVLGGLAPFIPTLDVGLLRHQAVSYTHLRAHETVLDLVCCLLLGKQKTRT